MEDVDEDDVRDRAVLVGSDSAFTTSSALRRFNVGGNDLGRHLLETSDARAQLDRRARDSGQAAGDFREPLPVETRASGLPRHARS
jgi:hypothetical protein